MAVNLDTDTLDKLNSEESVALHKLMDTLTSCGVGKLVDLPQIIVVGGQSAGKSSVLEAISRVKFPVAGGICTRFATEIILREADKPRVEVSVRFHDQTKTPKFFERSGFSEDDLAEIIEEARSCMGISKSSREFSKDVLRLVIEGPKMYPLTLVDLPGIFQVDTGDQSLQGKEVVDQLLDSYMKQKNSIMLVVVEANGQIACHTALARVKAHDPKRERTMGVITKPDLAARGYTENSHIELAKNQEPSHKLKLGWHVLRNRAEDEADLDMDARDAAEEAFFQSSAWKTIVQKDRGIASLRKKLSKELYNHIRKNLPSVIEDIETKLGERQADLNKFGLGRSSIQDMRSFLLQIASEFQRLARDGITGSYSDSFFGHVAKPQNRLRADLKSFYRAFEYNMKSSGHTFNIKGLDGDNDDNDNESSEEEDDEDEDSEENDTKPSDMLATVADFLATHPLSPELPSPTRMDRKEMNAWLEKYAVNSVGRELPGICNSDLVIKLFQWQARPWEDIARSHINGIMDVAKDFVEEMFLKIVGRGDAYTTMEGLLSEFVDPFFEEKEMRLETALADILWPYKEGYAVPLDEEFREILSNWRIQRVAAKLQKMPVNEVQDERTQRVMKSEGATMHMAKMLSVSANSGTFATEEAIQMMQAYYEMSRRTYTDNIINLAVERCLVYDLPNLFSPLKVGQLTDEKIMELAAESQDAQAQRAQLTQEVATLRKGLEKCRRWRPRSDPGQPQPRATKKITKESTSSVKAIMAAPSSSSTLTTQQQQQLPLGKVAVPGSSLFATLITKKIPDESSLFVNPTPVHTPEPPTKSTPPATISTPKQGTKSQQIVNQPVTNASGSLFGPKQPATSTLFSTKPAATSTPFSINTSSGFSFSTPPPITGQVQSKPAPGAGLGAISLFSKSNNPAKG
ncbi:hypothetical protein VHEMI09208 [[Torrubiella] hemipterigena]|nr:hypothetical protein VHEMI09208 [[Torrubiella] hemipterigena]